MASFTKGVSNIYKTDTYLGTKNTYDWIIKALYKDDRELNIKTEFRFNISDITCSCQGIEEFVENAYGQADYDLVSMNMSVYSKDKLTAYIIVNPFGGIRISTDSKVMLEHIVNLLENTFLDEEEANNPIVVTHIETQINNDGVIIQGNSNIVASNHSKVEIEHDDEEKEASGFKKFWLGVIQNIATNFIWYLLSLAAGAICAYLAMR